MDPSQVLLARLQALLALLLGLVAALARSAVTAAPPGTGDRSHQVTVDSAVLVVGPRREATEPGRGRRTPPGPAAR